MESRWLSVEQLSTYLGVSKETIYRWLEKRIVPSHRVGKLWKFDSEEVDDWIKAGGAASRTSSRSLIQNSNKNMES